MEFILGVVVGFIAGLALSATIVAILTYWRRPIEEKVKEIEEKIEAAHNPPPEAFIYDPESEANQAREQIIEANRKKGLDTRLSDLIDE